MWKESVPRRLFINIQEWNTIQQTLIPYIIRLLEHFITFLFSNLFFKTSCVYVWRQNPSKTLEPYRMHCMLKDPMRFLRLFAHFLAEFKPHSDML